VTWPRLPSQHPPPPPLRDPRPPPAPYVEVGPIGPPSPAACAPRSSAAAPAACPAPDHPPAPGTSAPPVGPTTSGHRTWADLARGPVRLGDISQPALQDSLTAARAALSSFRRTPPLRPMALYFSRVVRGPLSTFRAALRQCLPASALLGLSFVGGSVCEVVTAEQHQARVISSFRLLGFPHLASFDPTGDALKATTVLTPSTRRSTNLLAAYRRWSACADSSRHPVAAQWYRSNAQRLTTDPGFPRPGPTAAPTTPASPRPGPSSPSRRHLFFDASSASVSSPHRQQQPLPDPTAPTGDDVEDWADSPMDAPLSAASHRSSGSPASSSMDVQDTSSH
jgi:hypothetical protein